MCVPFRSQNYPIEGFTVHAHLMITLDPFAVDAMMTMLFQYNYYYLSTFYAHSNYVFHRVRTSFWHILYSIISVSLSSSDFYFTFFPITFFSIVSTKTNTKKYLFLFLPHTDTSLCKLPYETAAESKLKIRLKKLAIVSMRFVKF